MMGSLKIRFPLPRREGTRPLAGAGKGDLNGLKSFLFTLSLTLSRQGRGNYKTYYEAIMK